MLFDDFDSREEGVVGANLRDFVGRDRANFFGPVRKVTPG